ncbi:ribosome maturation factor rimP [Nitzschia inconspicua]|uniref:Ribosome maturation factor rimP n=1 Tax=Nitzschia inconspicua TaxID=303405 RepID=A0A9K3KB65_9STRA|nr:ribosome maturation factor rimP [Nitzschia inconspicua]KAG7340579.1 ribosome maturation factor rimP [Nitzschia inconspicua]
MQDHSPSPTTQSSFRHSSTALFMSALPAGYQDFGNFVIIQKVAKEQFGLTDDQISVEWKPGRIVVTVRGNVFLSNDEEIEDDGLEDFDEEEVDPLEEDLEFEDDDETEEEEEQEFEQTPSASSSGVDVTQLARAINMALDDDGVGFQIAETHEIEVTTPGASNELTGIMFQAYKGFEVMTDFQDPKTKKVKTIEGRLVERNDEFTVLNIKGRMKKIKNDMVLSVKLPKAKKEKGAAKSCCLSDILYIFYASTIGKLQQQQLLLPKDGFEG